MKTETVSDWFLSMRIHPEGSARHEFARAKLLHDLERHEAIDRAMQLKSAEEFGRQLDARIAARARRRRW